jgi:hypothetical protein
VARDRPETDLVVGTTMTARRDCGTIAGMRGKLTIAIAFAAVLLGGALPTGAAARSIRFFQSPSHNIGCVMVRGKYAEARCDIAKHSWKAPKKPKSCQLDYGNGLLVTRHGKGRFVCAGDTVLHQGKVLAYGKAIRWGPFKCKSKRSGVRCVNRRNGHGFKLSRQRARRF